MTITSCPQHPPIRWLVAILLCLLSCKMLLKPFLGPGLGLSLIAAGVWSASLLGDTLFTGKLILCYFGRNTCYRRAVRGRGEKVRWEGKEVTWWKDTYKKRSKVNFLRTWKKWTEDSSHESFEISSLLVPPTLP